MYSLLVKDPAHDTPELGCGSGYQVRYPAQRRCQTYTRPGLLFEDALGAQSTETSNFANVFVN